MTGFKVTFIMQFNRYVELEISIARWLMNSNRVTADALSRMEVESY